MLHVGWHGEEIGTLSHDGAAWRWRPRPEAAPNPVTGGLPGQLPPFIESLLPEGWLERILAPRARDELITLGKRYLSNIVVSPDPRDLETFAEDRLDGRLGDWSAEGRFTGAYRGPAPASDRTLEDRMALLYRSEGVPRPSGVQIKIPMTLSRDGVLRAADGTAFTHILKPAPGAGLEAVPSVEAASLAAARACGFAVAEHALVTMPDGLPDALVVERFDIRTGPGDRRRLALEDMASVRGVSPRDKYEGSIEQVARAARPVVADPGGDTRLLLGRALFAWLTADGDMHLKNLALLKVAPAGARDFASVGLAPVYDAVTTRVFPNLENDPAALAVAGKRSRLGRADFVRAGVTMGMTSDNARATVHDIAALLASHLETSEAATGKVAQARDIWANRLEALGD